MFIIVTIFYHSCAIVSGESNNVSRVNCDCDVLQITTPDGSSSNFTKQNGLISMKPYYLSMKRSLISWRKRKWSYDKFDPRWGKFMTIQKLNENFFSFEKTCNKITKRMNWEGKIIDITSQCLRHNSNCLATRELSWTRSTGGSKTKRIKLQAKNPCKFPFIYRNVTYNSCTKKDYNKIWCATTVNATNHETSFGICNALCPREDFVIKPDEVVVKSLDFKLEVGISVGVFLILAFIIGCICIKKKKMITQESGKYYYSTLLNNHTCIRIFHLGMHLFTVRIYKNLII